MTGFATLRKKFIRKRRSSKACDHGRVIREVVTDWSALEVSSIYICLVFGVFFFFLEHKLYGYIMMVEFCSILFSFSD